MKHLQIDKSPFNNVLSKSIMCKMYPKILEKLCWLGRSSEKNKGFAEKETRSNSPKVNFAA